MSKKTIEEYISEWDPMGFIRDGFPADEYDMEAGEIRLRFKPEMTDAELGQMIHGTFVELMSIDPDGFEDDCVRRVSQIRQVLLSSRRP